MNNATPVNMTDHDLLIRIDTRQEGMDKEVRLLRDDTNNKILGLQTNKLERQEFTDFKVTNDLFHVEKIAENGRALKTITDGQEAQAKKVDKLYSVYLIGSGVLLTIQFIVPLILHHFGLL